MSTFLKQIRVSHWIKNLLVFAPVLVSYRFFAFEYYTYGNFVSLFKLFFAFSFLASLSYIVNDFLDLEEDKKHPAKQKRPLASGKISKNSVVILAIILFAAVVLLSLGFNWKVQVILLAYLVLNLLYSLKLKTIPLLEFFFIAFMYFLRLKAGGELLDLNPSDWLILMVFFLALFMIV
ncbi:MAG: UbiA family prenyltransferase, partial [bacterium]|nr:UbiA family prenyltransferase [bacterium]